MFPRTLVGFLVDSWWILVGMSVTWSKIIKYNISQGFGRIPGEFLVDSWWILVGMSMTWRTMIKYDVSQDFGRIPGGFLVESGRNEYDLEYNDQIQCFPGLSQDSW